MSNSFDLRNFLKENKLTKTSQLVKENYEKVAQFVFKGEGDKPVQEKSFSDSVSYDQVRSAIHKLAKEQGKEIASLDIKKRYAGFNEQEADCGCDSL